MAGIQNHHLYKCKIKSLFESRTGTIYTLPLRTIFTVLICSSSYMFIYTCFMPSLNNENSHVVALFGFPSLFITLILPCLYFLRANHHLLLSLIIISQNIITCLIAEAFITECAHNIYIHIYLLCSCLLIY